MSWRRFWRYVVFVGVCLLGVGVVREFWLDEVVVVVWSKVVIGR